MKNSAILIPLMLVVASLNAEPTCQKCERIRAENIEKSKDQDWVFYEDWLEKKGKSKTEVESDKDSTPVDFEDSK